MAMSDFTQNYVNDALYRGGALNAAGTVNSTATVKGIWTATTAYSVGDKVVPHASMTAAGGKFLECTVAGTSGSTNTLAVPAVGTTLTDNTVTWKAVSGVPCPSQMYFALLTNIKGSRANSTAYSLNDTLSLTANDGVIHLYKVTTAGTTAAAQSTLYPGAVGEAITDGTAVLTEQTVGLDANTAQVEATGTGYARVALNPSLTNWAGTQAAASTAASSGTNGTTSNNSAITFAAPGASWQPAAGQIWGYAIYDQATGGNLLYWAPLTIVQTVNNGQSAPSFAAAALSLKLGL